MGHAETMARLRAELEGKRAATAKAASMLAATRHRVAGLMQQLSQVGTRPDPATARLAAKVGTLSGQLDRTNAETKAIDRGLAREDRAADKIGGHHLILTGPSGARYYLSKQGRKVYLRTG